MHLSNNYFIIVEIATSSTTASTSVQETTRSNDITTTKDITESSTTQTSLPNERTTSKPKPLPGKYVHRDHAYFDKLATAIKHFNTTYLL
jgi:hypothetical protein